MKITVERDAFNEAMTLTKLKVHANIPILSHVLIETEDNAIKITANNLDCCCEVKIPADVEEAGAIAIPSDRVGRLLAGLPKGSQIAISADERSATARAGRSSYRFSLLPAADFPGVMEVKDAVTFTLTADHALQLFKVPSPCISTEQTRIYLNGINIARQKNKLAACATDGHRLVETTARVDTPAFESVIVPGYACEAIARLAADENDLTFELSKNIISVTRGHVRFVTKLIDATFPSYDRVLPPSEGPTITVDATALEAALSRLLAACDPEKAKVVKLEWSENPETITASLSSDMAFGQDEIECDSSDCPAGRVGIQIDYLRSMIDCSGGENIKLYVRDAESVVRVENPQSKDFAACVMPFRLQG